MLVVFEQVALAALSEGNEGQGCCLGGEVGGRCASIATGALDGQNVRTTPVAPPYICFEFLKKNRGSF